MGEVERKDVGRWTPQAVIGLLALIAGVILRLWFEVDERVATALSDVQLAELLATSRTGIRIGDGLLLFGGSLLGWAPALPGLFPSSGSGPRTGAGVGIVLGTTAMLAGCGPRLVTPTKTFAVDIWPGPPCVVELRADGELEVRADWPKACEPTVKPLKAEP